ncbi:MAG: hypothetical protein U9R25_01265 [Chloroflexota bacterium]|nr:hypothetical protein [Chloroflexota bacterium]
MMSGAGQHFPPSTAEPFVPDQPPAKEALWASECKPWTTRMVTHYLEHYSRSGDLVLDPFAGQSPLAEASRFLDRQILLSHFSPATMLGVKTSATPPAQSVLSPAFSRVADAPRRGHPLSDYIQQLYETICPECARNTVARYFVWDRVAGEPIAKGYVCDACQSAGEIASDLADVERAANFEMRGAAYWGMLSRLVAPGDPETDPARQLLNLYTPRALVALGELITAIDQRIVAEEEQEAARALLLHVLERCISLHEPPEQLDAMAIHPMTRAHGLTPPDTFVEYNVWLAFEQAYQTLKNRPERSLPLAFNLNSFLEDADDRLLLQSSALPDLAKRLGPASVSLMLTDPPRLDPLFYATSFVWTGWLFGRAAADRLRSTLTITRWNWDWYARVMTTAFRTLRETVKPDGHLVLAFSDRTTRRALALLVAAAQSGWRLVAHSVQTELAAHDGLTFWRFVLQPQAIGETTYPAGNLSDALRQTAQESARQVIDSRGEPCPALLVHSASAIAWAETGLLARMGETRMGRQHPVSFLVEQARLSLNPELPAPGLRVFSPPDRDPQVSLQWFTDELPERAPLADRVEGKTRDLLLDQSWAEADLAAELYNWFPGLETPDAGLLQACIDSYAVHQHGQWTLRAQDQPDNRAMQLGNLLNRLHELGHRLGFSVWISPEQFDMAVGLIPLSQGGPKEPLHWAPASLVWHQNGRPSCCFALTSSAFLQPWLRDPGTAIDDSARFVVVPDERAGLLVQKLQRTPALHGRLTWTGWLFVKTQGIHELAALSDLTLSGFRARIAMDQILTAPAEQLDLFAAPEGARHAF